ncbi:MAG: universal stress protein [Solirubrobacteraceae bacterium]|nr:universal stress protein [Solirubrobacteraceae bacterium]
MSTLVVGYDGSDCARAALETAIGVAGAFGDGIVVVFAYQVSRLGGEVEDYARALRERATEVLGHAVDQAAAHGVTVATEVAEEGPAKALVDAAAAHDARAIVVGTRGEHPLKGALVGSTPHRLLQIADRPLLVVPDTGA